MTKLPDTYEEIKDQTNGYRYTWTNVIYSQKAEYELTFAEYCVLDYIHQGSRFHQTNEGIAYNRYKENGFCIAKPKIIAENLGLDRSTVNKTIKKFVEKRWLAQTEDGLALSIPWKTGKSLRKTKGETYSRFENWIRTQLKLTFLEYATLLYLEQLIKKSKVELVQRGQPTGRRVTNFPKAKIGEGIGKVDRETISRILKRLEKRRFLTIVQFSKRETGIFLLVDMEVLHTYTVDSKGMPYIPEQTLHTD